MGTIAVTLGPTIPGLLTDGSQAAPALVSTDGPTLTRGELAELVRHSSRAIRSAGVARQDRVAILIPHGFEMAIALLGVAGAAVAIPLNPALRAPDISSALLHMRADAIVTLAKPPIEFESLPGMRHLTIDSTGARDWSADGDRLPGAPVQDPRPDDVAIVLYTSGTTGQPKGVPLTHRNLAFSAENIASWFSLDETDRSLTVMPLFHIHGIAAGLLAPIAAAGTVIAPPKFDATRFAGWLEQHRPTWYTAVPTMHQMILARAAGSASPRLRFVRSSSAPLPLQVMGRLQGHFQAPVIETLGMTEASHQVAANPLPPAARKPGSVGLPAGAEIRILQADGAPVGAGEIGEIEVSGPGVFAGYEGGSASGIVDGWFRTGDLGRSDEDGYVFITGRLKEMINRGGEKIAPREVEDVLLAHPAVAEAAAFAIADRWLGEEVAVAVVLHPGAIVSEGELITHAKNGLPAFKVPRLVTITDDIPKGDTGKIQRATLARRLGLELPA